MAVSAFVVRDLFDIKAVVGPQRTTAGASIETCVIDVIPSPNDGTQTYAQANDAQVTALGTAMAAIMRDGRTITPLQACFAAIGDENGSKAGAKTCTISGGNLTFEVTGGDISTEHANAALAVYNDGIKLFVTYSAI
jgi:hypothetical protein